MIEKQMRIMQQKLDRMEKLLEQSGLKDTKE